jgi:catechol 2,3-dioxygenase-like lactoylglutathione lyase family enzyme
LTLQVLQLDHITITATDPQRSVRFYAEVLGMEPCWNWPGEITMLRSGSTFIAIAHWATGEAASEPPPITVDHFAFRVDRATYERAPVELRDLGIPVDHESDHGICRSLYLRDPDGHLVELVCYELTGAGGTMPRNLGSVRAGSTS